MKLGYIHSSKEEQTKVLQVLKMTSESVALDELGIGRIRDAFADLMFPGTSTLQKHIKYFSLMPQVYKEAMKKHYNRRSEVRGEIVRLERIMTEKLCEDSINRTGHIEPGITGSEMIKNKRGNYVKYDPAYIYNSGLQTFEILKSTQLYELIFSASNAQHKSIERYKTDDEDSADDTVEKEGLFQFCSFPNVDYDFTKSCSLNLTKEDKEFIVGHILGAKACKGTLLRYFVDNLDKIEPHVEFENIKGLPQNLAHIHNLACKFADFIYILYVRYNYIFSDYKDSELLEEFNYLAEEYRMSGTNMKSVLAAVSVRDNNCKAFCLIAEQHLLQDNICEGGELDKCIIDREKRIKQSRHKIGNPSYIYDSKKRIHYYKLTYRWGTVQKFIDELKKEVFNG